MKLYLSCDIEGLAGISMFEQEHQDTQNFRELYHKHIEWVLQGIQESRANNIIDEITISDSHSKGVNLNYLRLSEIDERISLINGFPRKNYMMSGLDKNYDLVFFIGYHAGIGEKYGNMDHGYSARVAYHLKINGKYMNETTINAAYAGELGIPVGLVIGDSALENQLLKEKMMQNISFVATKQSLARYACKSYPINQVKNEIINATINTLEKNISSLPLYKISMPAEVEIQCSTTAQADQLEMLSIVNRIDGRCLSFTSQTMEETMNNIVALATLGGTIY